MEIIQQPLGDAGPLDRSFPPRLVLHTTEGSHYPGPSIYHGTNPTFTCDVKNRKTYQHCSMDRAAKALIHPPSVETNHANAVQIEIVTFAAHIRELSSGDYAYLRRLILHIDKHHGMGRHFATPWEQARFTVAHWRTFKGVCGHMHVPGNDHVDPGNIDVGKLR